MPTILTRLDRCDRCGARAEVLRLFPAGELLFCQHHARQYGFTDPPTHEQHHDAYLSAPCRDE